MANPLFHLEGKNALITGSSRGIGYVLACGIGKAGATVVLNARNRERLSDAHEQIAGKGIRAHSYAFDVTDRAQVKEAVSRIESETGPIDILINNAGINKRGPLEDIEESVWHEVLDTNLTSVFLVTQQIVKGMIQRKQGKIINICSLMSELGRPTTGPYTASKGGVKMLTKAMATEWARYNIQVNGIGPGYFITEMTKPLEADVDFNAWICKRTPAGRWGDPQELIGPLIFLASEASNFINGQIIYVDGGVLSSL